MAGDWIKLEHTTPDKPEVVQMAARLRIDQDAVLGKLLRLWIWADQNSLDGNAARVTDAFLDRLTARKGFAAAMREAGWLSGANGIFSFPNFERHNGKTAKARAETNRRVANHRQRNENVTPELLQNERSSNEDVTETPLPKPLPEKRREEKSISISLPEPNPSSADSSGSEREICEPEDWAERIARAYPVNGNRNAALAAVQAALKGGEPPESMLKAVEVHAAKFHALPQAERQFCPALHTYFEGGRWRDNPHASPWRKPGSRKTETSAPVVAKPAPVMPTVPEGDRATLADITAAKKFFELK